MEINKNTILYFTGTGNSLQIANDINNETKDFQLVKITSLKDAKQIAINSKVLGIVFPVYYSRVPLIVEEILKRLSVSNDTYVFAVATYAGIASDVLVKLAKFLKNQNIKLNSAFQVRMPGNNIFSHGAMPRKWQQFLFKREVVKVKNIVEVIKMRKDLKYPRGNAIFVSFDKATKGLTDKIMSEFNYRDKEFWTNERCNGCNLCNRICSVNNIKIIDKKPVWQNKCEQCAACIQYCPMEAIQWGKKTEKRSRYRNMNVKELIEKF